MRWFKFLMYKLHSMNDIFELIYPIFLVFGHLKWVSEWVFRCIEKIESLLCGFLFLVFLCLILEIFFLLSFLAQYAVLPLFKAISLPRRNICLSLPLSILFFLYDSHLFLRLYLRTPFIKYLSVNWFVLFCCCCWLTRVQKLHMYFVTLSFFSLVNFSRVLGLISLYIYMQVSAHGNSIWMDKFSHRIRSWHLVGLGVNITLFECVQFG